MNPMHVHSRPSQQRRRGFSLMELVVSIGIISLLMALLLTALEKVRHRAYVTTCASNHHSIGQAFSMYSSENHGSYPRTTYVPDAPLTAGTGTAAPDAFATGGPGPNDVTAPLWLLARLQKLPTLIFVCAYGDVNEFTADKLSPLRQSNFTDFRKNLGYSYSNPYPSSAAAKLKYAITSKTESTFAVMADLNPGIDADHHSDVFRPTLTSTGRDIEAGNSANHEGEGQNVLFIDGHVSFELTPLCGTNHDNIYTAQGAVSPNVASSPAGPGDSILLPSD